MQRCSPVYCPELADTGFPLHLVELGKQSLFCQITQVGPGFNVETHLPAHTPEKLTGLHLKIFRKMRECNCHLSSREGLVTDAGGSTGQAFPLRVFTCKCWSLVSCVFCCSFPSSNLEIGRRGVSYRTWSCQPS